MTATFDQAATWWTRYRPDTSGIRKFTIVIRGEHDPSRTARPPGGRLDRAPHLTLRRSSVEDHYSPILDTLAKHDTLTFNGLCVLIYDQTADMLFDTIVEEALWRLVEVGKVQYTTWAPILFAIEPTGKDVPLPAGHTSHRALAREKSRAQDPQLTLF